jgi:lipopolysaccharide/colanic/teichoic acid biosynthesis glycosyltransferase
MTETSYDLGSMDRTALLDRRRSELSLLLIAPAFVISFLILPQIYGWIVWGPAYLTEFQGRTLIFLVQNALANFMVIVSCLGLKERLDRKLASSLTRTVFVHGSMAFLVLVLHQFHSNQIMLLGVLGSCVLGPLFMFVDHLYRQPRVAVLEPGSGTCGIDLRCDIVLDPEQDLRHYDIVLTSELGELPPRWAATLTRAALSGTPVRHLAEYIEERHGFVSIDHFDVDHLPVGGLTSYVLRKRLIDIALVLGTLPITLPLLLLGMALIRLTMGAPIFFTQARTGLEGREFLMYKLRTMRPLTPTDKQRPAMGDLRITPVGRWLRKTRIDEIPQLLNVLRGDMSVIGPRPEWTLLSSQYSEDLPVYAYRHLVRPGITGWAQVRSGYAADLAETKIKVGYDLFYIKNLSFALDMQILVRTVWTVLSGRGAR